MKLRSFVDWNSIQASATFSDFHRLNSVMVSTAPASETSTKENRSSPKEASSSTTPQPSVSGIMSAYMVIAKKSSSHSAAQQQQMMPFCM